ncbi:flavodoxin family protein [Lyticum sinuosum]|uniref:Flavodoxin family protein n=1 Tax=Lyticum sinuosum TaxID=1332059 RepID=A0AAE4VJD3_9RICK|nr:flavodoxin family protein [Lyticum sinuosum]MDZ5761095.1 Flavodoxin family protein [Lyticum sinuosum]
MKNDRVFCKKKIVNHNSINFLSNSDGNNLDSFSDDNLDSFSGNNLDSFSDDNLDSFSGNNLDSFSGDNLDDSLDTITQKLHKKVAIIYYNHPSRRHYLKKIALKISEGLKTVNIIPYLFTVDEAKNYIHDITNNMSGIIFGSPTYFGGCASQMRSFFEFTDQIFIQRLWKNKISAGFTHSGNLSGDKLSVLNEISIFALQHGMIWTGLDVISMFEILDNDAEITGIPKKSILNRLGSWMGMMSSSEYNVDDLNEIDLNTAIYFGYRIGNIVKSFYIT